MLWALMNNLGFLFCLGLASGLAKTRKAEAAFVAAMTRWSTRRRTTAG